MSKVRDRDRRIYIVGCGPGHKDYLTVKGLDVVHNADLLVGSERLLAAFPESQAVRMPLGSDYHALTERINCQKGNRIVILVSGDPGFFSLAKIVIKRFGIADCTVIPGISSAQLAFARIGESWNDARFISLHGRDTNLDGLMKTIRQNRKIAVLTDDVNNPQKIAEVMIQNGIVDRDVYIFENLSLEGETIHRMDVKSMRNVCVNEMNIVVIIDSGNE